MNLNQQLLPGFFLKTGIISLFQKNLSDGDQNDLVKAKEQEDATDFSRIRCPLCRWQPKATSLWFCADADFPEYYFNGCGTAWNTFATGGVCPGCTHRWSWTTCLACTQWSPHKDWYAGESDKI